MIVDLTRTLEDGQPGVAVKVVRQRPRDGWNASSLELYSHTGTHLDAPAHFFAGRQTVDRIPLQHCMGTAHVIDLTALPALAPIEVAHLGEVAIELRPGESLLLRTGWSAHFGDPGRYRQFPRVSESLARWCVGHGVRMLGVESPSVADTSNLPEVTLIHEILLEAGVVIVEGLVNLDLLASRKVFFAALPLKVGGGDGSPCRAFAIDGELSELLGT